ncbi:Carbohydrate sulfotransferase 11 [Amphibalanus amphitrite]|uniref:Carbohydrate sulfotransferase n=1 Tax=Amphibalanus amphitrite TaxID=1232801 RepID=A0A6A4V7Y6_AMPAM|nr:Carbohydrate sulfotransferase 11 [Amphibalanus amphitrite]
MFGILTGTLPNTSLEAIDHEKAHMYYVHRTLSQLSEPEIRRRLETYTSFMFVRHPLERMVSGYRDKLGPNSTHRFRRIHAVEIMGHPKSDKARLNKSETLRSSRHSNNLPTITFDRFAAWVVAAGPFDLNKGEPMEGPQNEHWRPMTDMCHPCTIPYTVLGRTATLDEDARLVLRTANITSVKFPEGYRSATPGVTESLVNTVTSDGLRGVLRHYLQDLFLFGYRPQEVFQNTTARDIVQTMYEELLAEAQHDVGSEDLEAEKVSDK